MKTFVYSKKDSKKIAEIKNVVSVNDFGIINKLYIQTKDGLVFNISFRPERLTTP